MTFDWIRQTFLAQSDSSERLPSKGFYVLKSLESQAPDSFVLSPKLPVIALVVRYSFVRLTIQDVLHEDLTLRRVLDWVPWTNPLLESRTRGLESMAAKTPPTLSRIIYVPCP